jgi:hypothetical protein
MLNVADIVLTSCELALLSTDPEVIARCIGHSKKSYDSLLRAAGRLSFTVQDVQAFELKAVMLESLIARLGQQYDSKTRFSAVA